jgi:aminoglycoside phosphotransferase (APT) family kinase protein
VHGDLRSDNICLLPDRIVFVDWSGSGRGSGDTDLALLLPTLHLEGAPRPYDVMPDGAEWAAWQTGQLAVRAISGNAPAWLIRVLIRLARINLVWAANCLGLDEPLSVT